MNTVVIADARHEGLACRSHGEQSDATNGQICDKPNAECR